MQVELGKCGIRKKKKKEKKKKKKKRWHLAFVGAMPVRRFGRKASAGGTGGCRG